MSACLELRKNLKPIDTSDCPMPTVNAKLPISIVRHTRCRDRHHYPTMATSDEVIIIDDSDDDILFLESKPRQNSPAHHPTDCISFADERSNAIESGDRVFSYILTVQ